MKITKREIIAFFVGVISLFLIETIVDWKDVKSSYVRGFYDGYNLSSQK